MSEFGRLPQGDLRLLQTEIAQRLLGSAIPARVAYVARDGTPRIYSTFYVWDGEELVMATFPGALRLVELREQPRIAVSIDTESVPPEVLLLRGDVTLSDAVGVVPEYAEGWRRAAGSEAAEEYLATLPEDVAMVRIGLRPDWVGVLDFRERLPQRFPG